MLNNKSAGLDGLSAEHLKYAGDRLFSVLSVLFNSIFTHGHVPLDMIKSVIVPVIKNKAKSSTMKSNYRPVTLATIISKVMEKIIHAKIEPYLYSSHNQFLKENMGQKLVSLF
jgi:hypothetical protein